PPLHNTNVVEFVPGWINLFKISSKLALNVLLITFELARSHLFGIHVQPRCSSHSATSLRLAATVDRRILSRVPSKRTNLASVSSGVANAINTMPTAFPSDGSGPATPVVAIPRSLPNRSRAP